MTAEAAAMLLGTNPAMLTLWERRFGYPVAQRAADGQLLYPDEMVLALRDALTRELSIAAAVTEARRPPSDRRRRRDARALGWGPFVVSLEGRGEAR